MMRKEILAPLRDPVRFVKTAGLGKSTDLLPYQLELMAQLQEQTAVRLSFNIPRRILGCDRSK